MMFANPVLHIKLNANAPLKLKECEEKERSGKAVYRRQIVLKARLGTRGVSGTGR